MGPPVSGLRLPPPGLVTAPPPARAPERELCRQTTGEVGSGPTSEPSPLDVVGPLIRVRQIREFTGKRVTKAEMEAITEVARWSGSSRNEQPLRFVALRDKTTIEHIAELGLPQTRGLPTANAAIAIIVPDEAERELLAPSTMVEPPSACSSPRTSWAWAAVSPGSGRRPRAHATC